MKQKKWSDAISELTKAINVLAASNPSHARKMASLLQASSGLDLKEKPVLLWVERDAGHAQGKLLNMRIRDVADQWGYLMWQLGL